MDKRKFNSHREELAFMMNQNYWNTLKKNYKRNKWKNLKDSIIASKSYDTPLLNYLFIWDKTPEGALYWINIYETLCKR